MLFSLNAFSTSSEAVARMCSAEMMFLKISQNSQENTCARASFLMKLKKEHAFYKSPPVAAFACFHKSTTGDL